VFLSEPLLASCIRRSDIIKLCELLCVFSLSIPAQFNDAINEIAFDLVSIQTGVPLFEALLGFIEQNLGSLNPRGFVCQMSSLGVSMIGVSQSQEDLVNLRAFVKAALGSPGLSKDDLRSVLCRSLLSELVSLEQQLILEAEQLKYAPKVSETQESVESEILVDDEQSPLEFVRIIDAVGRNETRAEGIRQLLEFEERFPELKVSESVIRLAPSLRRDIEAAKGKQRPGGRAAPPGSSDGSASSNAVPKVVFGRSVQQNPA
jgi:hypothetical protein